MRWTAGPAILADAHMITVRSKLRQELTRRFLPALRSRKFVGPESIVGSALLHEFRRTDGPAVHVLCIQMEKYQRPRFILDLSIESVEGSEAMMPKDGTVAHARVQPRPGSFSTGNWFRADPPWWHVLIGKNESLEAEAVSQALAMFEEIETWWWTQTSSAHVASHPVVFRSP